MKKPNFFIVGAPKCGTTAMNDYLAKHPQVFMAQKEVLHFGKDLKPGLHLSEEEYLRLFEKAGEQKIVGEASVWYLFSKTAAAEIKAFSPNAKILIMLRDPVEVLYSMHSQHLYNGNEDVNDFETAINLDDERKKGDNLPDAVDFLELPPYKDSVLFYEQVKRYLDVFGKENVHIVLYEDFIKDTPKVFNETLQFLGVTSNHNVTFQIVNANKKISSLSLHRFIKKPPKSLKKIARAIIPAKKIRHHLMLIILNANIKVAKRKKMNVKLQSELRSFFAEDILKLANIINRDLSPWLKEQ